MRWSNFNVAFVALSAALGLCLAWFRDLPMVDLPQHASQIGTWLHWHDPAFRAAELLELNFRTPYLLAYPLARLLAPVVGVVPALHFVIWLAIVGNVAALAYLAQQTGHDRRLALLGFPAAVGYSFYFGFVSFLLATPLAVTCMALSIAYAEAPSVRRGALLSALFCLTLTSHGFAFTIAVACCLPLLWAGRARPVYRFVPLLAPGLVAWLWIAPGAGERLSNDIWGIEWLRLLDLPASIIGLGARHWLVVLVGACLLLSALSLLGRPRRSLGRLMPLVLVVCGFALFPARFHDVGFLSGRFAGFVLPALLIAFSPRSAALSESRWGSLTFGLSLAFVCGWCCWFVARLASFNREAAPFHEFASAIPSGLRMRSIIFDRDSRAFPDVPAFLHYSAYYQAEKGGTQGYSFALNEVSVVRYRPGVTIGVPGAEWSPESFDARAELPSYDYFVVRSERDRGSELFGNVGEPMVLAAHVGSWWGYRREGFARADSRRAGAQ